MTDACIIFLLIMVISESKSKTITLLPKTPAIVEESENLDLTCRLDLKAQQVQWNLILQLSGFSRSATLIRLSTFQNRSCYHLSAANLSSKLEYRITCDQENNIVKLELFKISLAEHNFSVSCIAKINGSKEIETTRISVKVPVKSVRVIGQQLLAIQEHNVKQIQCQSSPSRPVADIKWFKLFPGHDHPVLLKSSTNIGEKVEAGNDLWERKSYLNYSANTNDSGGIIFCEASNDNNVVRSDNITIEITYEPRITKLEVSDEKALSNGTSFKLLCVVDSNPLSTITWLYEDDQKPLYTEHGVATSTLDIQQENCGNKSFVYICQANNDIGNSVQKEVNISIQSCKVPTVSNEESPFDIMWIIQVATIPVIVTLIVVMVRCYKRRYDTMRGSKKEIKMNTAQTVEHIPQNETDVREDNVLRESFGDAPNAAASANQPRNEPALGKMQGNESSNETSLHNLPKSDSRTTPKPLPKRKPKTENTRSDDQIDVYAQIKPKLERQKKAKKFKSTVVVHSLPGVQDNLQNIEGAHYYDNHAEDSDLHVKGRQQESEETSNPQENYIQMDLPITNNSNIHGKADRTIYTEVQISRTGPSHSVSNLPKGTNVKPDVKKQRK